MYRIFNTPFENALRLLLLLSFYKEHMMSLDRLTALDFIALYGRDLGISPISLNGQNTFSLCEYAAKRKLLHKAAKLLVLRGLIKAGENAKGFGYQITDLGSKTADGLDSDYAKEYRLALRFTEKYVEMPERQLISWINRAAAEKVQG